MRLIQVFVPNDVRTEVERTLDDAGVDYLLGDELSGRDGVIAHVPVPAGAVDAILDRLYDAGLDEDTYTVVTDVDRAVVPNADAVADRYVEGPKGEAGVSHPELRERADDLTPGRRTYIAFAALSAVVAVAGLLLDTAIVIVGAMVIAPFAGSTLSASVGAVISDREMVVESVLSQALGLVVAFLAAILMSLALQWAYFVPSSTAVSQIDQVSSFLTPGMLTLVIAVAAGFAGALALATDLPVSIAGVAVAAAIVPAAATAGIGVVWGDPLVALGAVVLLLMNIIFINVAAYVGLVSLGYRSSVVGSVRENVSVSVRTGAYAVVVLAFAVMLVLTSFATYQHIAYEQTVDRDVEAVLSDDTYEGLDLVGVQTDYNDMEAFGSVETVTVTVGRTADSEYPVLAEQLRERISDDVGHPVTVNVRYVDYQRAAAESQPTESPLTRTVDRLWATVGRAVGSGNVAAMPTITGPRGI
ncbi:TIGR00341 family protein [Halomarina ordinaria]|uniref:TIGR00341 family protein n=1 Tax=Halomarina ordinaria TaxID=3033939 RepID=A0ABD5U6N1_9EURY|nr:TIGR00341 family protein [Halomarina sp. PSRA2]